MINCFTVVGEIELLQHQDNKTTLQKQLKRKSNQVNESNVTEPPPAACAEMTCLNTSVWWSQLVESHTENGCIKKRRIDGDKRNQEAEWGGIIR